MADNHDHAHGVAKLFGLPVELAFALLSGITLAVGFAVEKLVPTAPHWVPLAGYVAAYFFGGLFTLREAVENALARQFKIDSLMLVAAAGAAILGEFAEGALLLFLFSLGHALESFAMGRAKRAIDALAELAPERATVLRDGSPVDVAVEELAETAGDLGVTLAPNIWPVNSEVREMAILADNYEMTISLLVFDNAPERSFGIDEHIDEDAFDRFTQQMR